MSASQSTTTQPEYPCETTQEIINQITLTTLKLNQLYVQLAKKINNQSSCSSNQQKILLSRDDYIRYGRQMIVPQVGLPGQLEIQKASVLVIGAGGLGCPALLYLARAGVGNISIVDHDTVELSNLHRQVLHTEFTVGMNKAESARINLLGNHSVKIKAYPLPFSLETLGGKERGGGEDRLPAMDEFTLVLDCTDNPDSRYLISDVCAAYGIPLVSGAGIRAEGQLSVWNLPSSTDSKLDRGPCYRCIFPQSQDIQGERCADQGVVGPIVGSVGVLMAWEAIRLLIGSHDLMPKLLLIPSFRTIKLRKRRKDCLGCSSGNRQKFLDRINENSSQGSLSSNENSCINKTSFFGKTCSMNTQQPDPQASTANRITPNDLLEKRYQLDEFQILDVRPQVQFEICSLPNSINIPINKVLENPEITLEKLKSIELNCENKQRFKNTNRWLVVCRRGNDSLIIAKTLNELSWNSSGGNSHQNHFLDLSSFGLCFVDLVGGLEAYSLQVNHQFPLY